MMKMASPCQDQTVGKRGKITPRFQKLFRFYNKKDNKAVADVIAHYDEVIDETQPYTIFDPIYTWKRKILRNYYVKELQIPVFLNGQAVYQSPSVKAIAAFSKEELGRFWDEVKRFENPHGYYVDLSQGLWDQAQSPVSPHRKYSEEDQ